MKRLKHGYMLVLLLAAIGSLYVGCETQKPTAIETTKQIAGIAKGQTYSFETIKPELQKLLDYVKSNPQIITPAVLAQTAERHATVADLGLTDKFPSEFPLDNGNTFEVYLELFDGSVGAGATIEDAEAYFTLDLDRYPDEAELTDHGSMHTFRAHVANTAHNMSKGLLAKGSNPQLGLKSTTEKVHYLLFFVGGEERISDVNEERIHQETTATISGFSKSQGADPTIYVWLVELEFKADNDWGDEEFELYYGDGTSATNPFSPSTNWRFDGRSHVDASGVSRVFPDINKGGTTYSVPKDMPHAIAIGRSASDFRLVAIEDDCSAGAHKNDHHSGGKHYEYIFGRSVWQIPFEGQYPFWIHDDCSNNDEIYTESAIAHEIFSTWGCVYIEPKGEFSDVKYRIRKGTVADADDNFKDFPSCN